MVGLWVGTILWSYRRINRISAIVVLLIFFGPLVGIGYASSDEHLPYTLIKAPPAMHSLLNCSASIIILEADLNEEDTSVEFSSPRLLIGFCSLELQGFRETLIRAQEILKGNRCAYLEDLLDERSPFLFGIEKLKKRERLSLLRYERESHRYKCCLIYGLDTSCAFQQKISRDDLFLLDKDQRKTLMQRFGLVEEIVRNYGITVCEWIKTQKKAEEIRQWKQTARNFFRDVQHQKELLMSDSLIHLERLQQENMALRWLEGTRQLLHEASKIQRQVIAEFEQERYRVERRYEDALRRQREAEEKHLKENKEEWSCVIM